MILREYLYVDSAAVRGLLAQLDSGVAESETVRTTSGKKSGAGMKGILEHGREWGEVAEITKGFSDVLFPNLENALEVQGVLSDISDVIGEPESWSPGRMEELLPPGRVVRVTAPGYLVDARFLASTLAGFAAAVSGLSKVQQGVDGGSVSDGESPAVPPKVKRASKSSATSAEGAKWEEENLEGSIPLSRLTVDNSDIVNASFLRGIVQLQRGLFAPGLHLTLAPEVEKSGTISVRLQEGKQYLDTDPDILFSRYGVGAQDWTVVGAIGSHPLPNPDLSENNFMTGDGVVDRSRFGRFVNQLATFLGNQGLADLPQAPGFSIVPWAVYRTIGLPLQHPPSAVREG